MNFSVLGKAAGITASALTAAIFAVPGPASAAVPASVHGKCQTIQFDSGEQFPWSPTGFYRAWCDGTGPDSYRSWVGCSDGNTYYGEWRWYGDRRGSTAWCPTNLKASIERSGPG